MNDDRDLTRADRALVDVIRSELAPEPLSPARAAQLRRELAERIERAPRPNRFRVAVPALALGALATALWLALPAPAPTVATDTSDSAAELEAYVDPDAFASELGENADYLPADYQVLALALDDAPADR